MVQCRLEFDNAFEPDRLFLHQLNLVSQNVPAKVIL